jgi:hypothetical protein
MVISMNTKNLMLSLVAMGTLLIVNVMFFNLRFMNMNRAHSVVRQALLKCELINFSQEYIELHYMEGHIPAKGNDQVCN